MAGPTKLPTCGTAAHLVAVETGTIKDGTMCLQPSPVPGFPGLCPKPIFKGAKCITPKQALKELENIPSNQVAWKVGEYSVTRGWIRKGSVIPTPKGDVIILGVVGYYGQAYGVLIYIRKKQIYRI